MQHSPTLATQDTLHELYTHAPYLSPTTPILPSPSNLQHARATLQQPFNPAGHGNEATTEHLMQDLVPALNGQSLSPRYYGFVIGGVTPIARLADQIVGTYDQDAHVHLERDGVSGDVEDVALRWVREMLSLTTEGFRHGTFTTGATASNVLGLAVGREWVVREKGARNCGVSDVSVAREGLLRACLRAGVEEIQILTDLPHSSIRKAASIVGLGHDSVKSIMKEGVTLGVDLEKLRREASKTGVATILCISCGEVSTGFFATSGLEEMKEIRKICDELGVWMHVDGAFGIYGRMLTSEFDHQNQYEIIRRGCEGVELADSITGDCHKFLNVPYDCAFFFSKSQDLAQDVFKNPNAVYLSTPAGGIPQPMNVGIENGRRFRALPVYANLHAYGTDGFRELLIKQITLARKVVGWMWDGEAFEVLPRAETKEEAVRRTYVVVLFRAKDEGLNAKLVETVNYGEGKGEIYVSGTVWYGKKATRIAVSNWQVDVERDFVVIKSVLERISKVQHDE